jgi:TPR repeat protein
MKNLVATLCLTVAVLFGCGEGSPDPFQTGLNAYTRGDYATALREFRPLAEQGYPEAQSNLGLMYANGEGVTQNYQTATMWYTRAAAQGNLVAQKNLNFMSRNELALGQQEVVPMVPEFGVFAVPVLINDTITLNFIVDSGASSVSIPEDVVSTLVRSGTITDADFTGTQTFVLADGSTTTKPTFSIRTLKVGDITLENIKGAETSVQGPKLLGQSFLRYFDSWSIDNSNNTLVLE